MPADGHDAIASAHNDYDALEVKANYYAMIEQIDDQFGRIMQTLRDSGQLENTIVVYMSDHGEMLGDHGLILKGCRFFDGLAPIFGCDGAMTSTPNTILTSPPPAAMA